MLDQISLSASDIRLANSTLDWLEGYISKSHPRLGRPGPMCPFVPAALREDCLSITIDRSIDGRDLAGLTSSLRGHVQRYLDLSAASPARADTEAHNASLIVFPCILEQNLSALDLAHSQLKNEIITRGAMIGQFHKLCTVPAARNSAFHIQVAPIPCVAIRPITLHDVLFVSADKFRFNEYKKRFGRAYEAGHIGDPLLTRAYSEACAVFDPA